MISKGLQTIIIPVNEDEYIPILERAGCFKNYIDSLLSNHPELFPKSVFIKGYVLDGFSRCSEKIPIKRRVIQIKGKHYIIHPCFVMPYLRGQTQAVSKGLELRRYNVPYHAIGRITNKDAMYWYRAELSLAQNSLVGTTIKVPSKLPAHIALDEHHSRLNKEKVYVATTVGQDCILGSAVSPSVSFADLAVAYQVYLDECSYLDNSYYPISVNLDGFKSTRKVVKELYPDSAAILCFLHGYLKIKTKASAAYSDYFEVIAHKIWHCYKAKTKRSFAQRFRQLQDWTEQVVPQSAFKEAVLGLCKKKMSIFNLIIINLVKEQVICWIG